jgi:hypothetical protein
MSGLVTKYRVFCTVENAYYTIWSETEPTKCPNCANAIDPTKTQVLQETELVEKNPSGIPFVQQTPRPKGTKTFWTGSGDNASNPLAIGNGERMTFYHAEGDTNTEVQSKIIKLNCMCNYSYIYKGNILVKNALFDHATLDVLPNVAEWEVGNSTNYWQNTTY